MKRLGKNAGGYFGETLDIQNVLREALASALHHGWQVDFLKSDAIDLPVLMRAPRRNAQSAPRIYLSTGIHGDEPAGPLAMQRLLTRNAFPDSAWYWSCPCLNPTGFPRNTRESSSGIDLNRDYRHRRSSEIRAHVAWLERQPTFDLSLCLHEDWEAAGFYVYELNPAGQTSLAPGMLDAVRGLCPIDHSPMIDGRENSEGIIRPIFDPTLRPEWPEAIYLIQHKTRLSYTLEAPSDFELDVRSAALEAAVGSALEAFTNGSRNAIPGG